MVEYGRPWITYDAIKWLDCFLNQTMRAFEWGSGGSTIFISQRVKHLISIEHDKKWYQLVLQSIEKNIFFNCE